MANCCLHSFRFRIYLQVKYRTDVIQSKYWNSQNHEEITSFNTIELQVIQSYKTDFCLKYIIYDRFILAKTTLIGIAWIYWNY